MRLWALAVHFKSIQQQLRYVDYQQAQRDCEALASQVSALYSAQELSKFTFVAIPRGGLIVLGMLAYLLNLRPEQLQGGAPDAATPVCIVDDCSLTGLRFAQQLAATRSDHVVFAHLYSHPALRQAIVEREARVRHCLAAQDLTAAPRRHDAGPHEERWRHLLGAGRYWIEPVEMVAFAWGEPNQHTLDPFTGQLENRWRFVPPHRCLKNKAELGVPFRAVEVAAWQAPASLVTGWFDGVLWLLQTETEQVYRFEGIQADMWRALAAYGDVDATLDFVHSRYASDRASLQDELHDLIQYLLAERLIEPTG